MGCMGWGMGFQFFWKNFREQWSGYWIGRNVFNFFKV